MLSHVNYTFVVNAVLSPTMLPYHNHYLESHVISST